MQYVSVAGDDRGGCFLCDHLGEDDDARTHILFRGDGVFVVLNAYPYNTGHLMVVPKRHVAELDELTPEERTGIMEVTHLSTQVIREAMRPQGFNIGMNLGSAGGAGVPGHLHVHVVPRWDGDTNYMTTIGDTKVLPEMLAETDAKLRPLFDRADA